MVSDANRQTPVFGAHGDSDQVVNLKFGELAHNTIAKFNSNASLKVYPYLQHSSSHAELRDVFSFILGRLKK